MGGTETAEALVLAYPNSGKTPDYFADEYPRHRVRITKAFLLGKFEVTVAQFRQFTAETGYKTEAESDGTGSWGATLQRVGARADNCNTLGRIQDIPCLTHNPSSTLATTTPWLSVSGSARRKASIIACRRKRNGNMRIVLELKHGTRTRTIRPSCRSPLAPLIYRDMPNSGMYRKSSSLLATRPRFQFQWGA